MAKLESQLEIPRCPHCGVDTPSLTNMWGNYTTDHSKRQKRYWQIYQCSRCGGVVLASAQDVGMPILAMYPNRNKEVFPLEYLPSPVKEDFDEALECYSNLCYNAFAAMCRRTFQSISSNLGAKGKDRVEKQLNDLKDMEAIKEDEYEIFKQIIIAGHDGSHPYLPSLSPERAKVILELMKDVLYEIYVRKAKVQEAKVLRDQPTKDKK